MDDPDAIVIGAGQNGLACACYLARAGLRVLVLEAYERVGGMTLTEELTLPGFRSDVHASGYQLANLSPVPGELDLVRHGLELVAPEYVYAHAFPDGRAIVVSRDLDASVADLARISPADAATFRSLIERYRAGRAAFIDTFFSPPGPRAVAPGDEVRFSLQSVRSWADATFASDEAKSLFGGFAAFVGSAPDDAGGAEIAWLFGAVLQAEGNFLVRGGMQGVADALHADLAAHGGQVRTGSRVEAIEVRDGVARGVRLAGGDVIDAGRVVVSATDPAQLVAGLLGDGVAEASDVAAVRRIEWGDAVMTVYLALDGPAEYAAGPAVGQAAQVHLSSPGLSAIAQASVECRAGLLPGEPFIVAWNNSTIDPGVAPQGRALMKLVVLGVPYEIAGDAAGVLGGRHWDEVREAYADRIVDLVDARYVPGLTARIMRRTVFSPLDQERQLSSAVRGTISHGAMLPYQIGALRPTAALSGYRTSVPNVYLCDSGTHPGPGVSMASGRNAFTVIAHDLGLAPP
ncbi:phytoene desaturase family protein [Agromyces sp. NPDC004153]